MDALAREPYVSVIVPVYDGAAYLAEAVESAIHQTARPFEIIVVDDGSTDGTAKIAQSYEAVRYVFQENTGISAARNRGIQRATGNYFALLDADDVWLPNKLEKQLGAFESATKPDIVFGQVQEFISPELPAEVQKRMKCESMTRPGVLPSAMLVTREAFWRVGLFEPRWRAGEFANWILRANEAGLQKTMIPDLVMRRRIHTANNGIRQREEFKDYARMIKASLDRRRAAGQE